MSRAPFSVRCVGTNEEAVKLMDPCLCFCPLGTACSVRTGLETRDGYRAGRHVPSSSWPDSAPAALSRTVPAAQVHTDTRTHTVIVVKPHHLGLCVLLMLAELVFVSQVAPPDFSEVFPNGGDRQAGHRQAALPVPHHSG